MAKTTYIDGNKGLGIRGTVVGADFLNALNNHRHTGADVDGDGAIDYAADTGAANAYAIALTPALTALVIGMPIRFKAGHANTGASTLTVNGLGPTPIKKMVSQVLVAGDILAGEILEVIYDGTNFQLMAPSGIILASSPGPTGYKVWADKSSSSGLYIQQWGIASAITPGQWVHITFPLAFTQSYELALSPMLTSSSYGQADNQFSLNTQGSGNTGFNLWYNKGVSPSSCGWIASGH